MVCKAWCLVTESVQVLISSLEEIRELQHWEDYKRMNLTWQINLTLWVALKLMEDFEKLNQFKRILQP